MPNGFLTILKKKIAQLTPQQLKAAVAKGLNELLAPIQAAYQASKDWQQIALSAYPPPPKKEKKVKDKGSRYPGGDKTVDNAAPAKQEDVTVDGAAAGVEKLSV